MRSDIDCPLVVVAGLKVNRGASVDIHRTVVKHRYDFEMGGMDTMSTGNSVYAAPLIPRKESVIVRVAGPERTTRENGIIERGEATTEGRNETLRTVSTV
jgi:hypothetical protein